VKGELRIAARFIRDGIKVFGLLVESCETGEGLMGRGLGRGGDSSRSDGTFDKGWKVARKNL